MFNKIDAVQLTMLLSLAYNAVLIRENDALHKKLKENHAEFRYIAHLLNKNDIVLDDFDLIALPSFKRKEISSQ